MNTSIRYGYRSLSLVTLMSALSLAGGTTGCSSNDDSVEASAEAIDKTQQPLAIGDLLSINGVYEAGCTDRSGSWSIAVEGGATLDNPALSVIKNDSACELTLTSIMADVEYFPDPEITLESSYQAAASGFEIAGGGPVAFYANSKINPADFSANFAVTILYSDDANAASGSNNSSYAEWSSSAVGDQVTAPDYGSVDNLAVSADASDVVTAALGSVSLTDGAVTGESYFVDLGTLAASPSYVQVETVFNAGSPTAIVGADPSIPASAFSLSGETLPVVRTLIIRHMESGVASFQTLKVTFNAP